MNVTAMEDQEKSSIIEEIKKKAASYTPEWRFDVENPDIGTALALVYADLFSGTLKHMNRIALKNEIAFFNCLGATLLPAIPARGYVRFALSNGEWGGVEVPMKTVVSADSEEEENGIIRYETVDDMYVTPARVEAVYQTCDNMDYIGCAWDGTRDAGEIPVFSCRSGNLQRHLLYISHETVLDIRHNGEVCLEFREDQGRECRDKILEALACPDQAALEYGSRDGFIPFERCCVRDKKVICQKDEGQPAFEAVEVGGVTSFWIRIRALNIGLLKQLAVSAIYLKSRGSGIEPDTVYGNGTECSLARYFPFGESLSPYSEVYFGSDEVLGKRGARIELSFGIDFIKIPLEMKRDMVEWDWVMRRSDFKPNLEYDITIDTVIWEYFNGSGWARLFSGNRGSDVFSVKNGTMGQYRTISFQCPMDMSPILVNARECCYVRARILKVNNLYKTLGNYIVPLLSGTVLSYRYDGSFYGPREIMAVNNLEELVFRGADVLRSTLHPFRQTGWDRPALYLGFSAPTSGGPVKLLMQVKNPADRKDGLLVWEYSDGKKWKPLNLADETEAFSKTGIVTMAGAWDMGRSGLFGRELCWIRICDVNGCYEAEGEENSPILSGILENTTKIVNVDWRETEYFTMTVYQENTRFNLNRTNLWELEVCVDERSELSERELEQLRQLGRVRIVRDDAGMVANAWVSWSAVEDFIESSAADRHYTYNPTEGYILFGSGRHGKIPPVSGEPNIQVRYVSGGGRRGNVASGRINKLNRAIGFINEVVNPEELTGGSDKETLREALNRSAAAVRTQKKAVTLRDYEELAMFASREIRQVKCFSCLDDKGEPMAGAVTLIILPKNREERQTQFARIKGDVFRYMKDKISGSLLAEGKFLVAEPVYVRMQVRVEAVVRDFNLIFKARRGILQALEAFFHPDGRERQWQIGDLPDNMQIRNAVNGVEDVSCIKKVFVSMYVFQNGRWVEADHVANRRFAYPIGGEHEVMIAVE